MLRLILCVFCFTATALHAQYVELGANISGAVRFEDRSTASVDRFRTNLAIDPFRQVRADQPYQFATYEFFFRFSGFIGDGNNHFTGISLGKYSIPSFSVSEFKSNGSFLISDWQYDFSFILLTYHYRGKSIRGLRNWSWEIGGGFGIVPDGKWTISGIRQTRFGVSELNTNHRARAGSMLRLEPALVRTEGPLIFRGGIRFEYVLLGNWKGNSSGDGSDWFMLADNSLILEPDLFELNRIANEGDIFSPVLITNGFVRERARHTFSTAQLFFSIGFRF